MAELTVVVTIYKVKEYLKRCLSSIVKQSFNSIEVMMVVGSDDLDCILICKEYERKDERFSIVLAEPKGLSDARNTGIALARTKYISFVDGDDYIHKDMFLHLMNAIRDFDCDISIGNYAVKESNKKIQKKKSPVEDGVYSGNEALGMFLCGHEVQFVVAWGKVYKTSLFTEESIRYPVGKLHEDNLTTYKLYYHSNKIVYTDKAVYIYVDRSTSLSYNTDLKKERIMLDDYYELEEYLSDRMELNQHIQAYHTSIRVNYIIKLSKTNDEVAKKEYSDEIQQLKRDKYLQNPKVRMRMKALCFAICKAPWVMKNLLMRYR